MSYNTGVRLLLFLSVFLTSNLVSSQKMGAFDFIWKEVGELEDVGTGEILVIKPKIVRKKRTETALVLNLNVTAEIDHAVGGPYHVDISLSRIDVKLSSFPFGKYKGDVEFTRLSSSGEEIVVGGFVGVAEINPKKKKG